MSQRWEYRVEQMTTADAGGLTQIINERAKEGWELISVSPPLLYFKRAKEDAGPKSEQDGEEDHIGRKYY